MKVSQLIEQLEKLPKNAVVVVTTDNFEQGNNTVEAGSVRSFKGKIVSERFRDAFDGGSYNKEVIRRDDEGVTTFVQIN